MKRTLAIQAAAALVLIPAGQSQSAPQKSGVAATRISVTCPNKAIGAAHWRVSGPSAYLPTVDATAQLNKAGELDVTVDMHRYNGLPPGLGDKVVKKVGAALHQAVEDEEAKCLGQEPPNSKVAVHVPKTNIKYIWDKPAAK